jgi:hypothetical protein
VRLIASPSPTPASTRTRRVVGSRRRCAKATCAGQRSTSSVPVAGRKLASGFSAQMRASIAWPRIAARPAQRQRLAGGHAQLPLDQVEPGDHLGDRVLHLQPRVHLHEVEAQVAVVGLGSAMNSTVPAPT